MTDKIVVFSACSSAEEAHSIARKLIEARLAGCINVIPRIRSFYRWKGAIEQAEEHMLVIKSSRLQFDALRIELERIAQLPGSRGGGASGGAGLPELPELAG